MTRVAIARTGDDIKAAVAGVLGGTGEPVVSEGDYVLIKPNLVRPEPPETGEVTNPLVVEAVARYCLELGAGKVVIGEGPGYYNRRDRLKDCFTRTGISEVARRLGIEWIFFDEHGYRVYKNVSDCTPKEFRVSEFAFDGAKIINLPALKTHYATRVTLAMKNLKGFLKWEDKPRFHDIDLARAVVELNKIIRPAVNIIDATNWKGSGLLLAGTDVVAVDAVGSALMGIDPAEVRTITLGAAAGLGEADLTRIDIVGEELKQLRFKVKLPQEELRESFPNLKIIGDDRACSGCLIPLLAGLKQLADEGASLEPLVIYLGKNPEVRGSETALIVGDCARSDGQSGLEWVEGCAPDKDSVVEGLRKFVIKG
jgi:uncharacterized protein (DUF362 family)